MYISCVHQMILAVHFALVDCKLWSTPAYIGCKYWAKSLFLFSSSSLRLQRCVLRTEVFLVLYIYILHQPKLICKSQHIRRQLNPIKCIPWFFFFFASFHEPPQNMRCQHTPIVFLVEATFPCMKVWQSDPSHQFFFYIIIIIYQTVVY